MLTFKNFLLVLAAGVTGVGSAGAADMAVKARPVPVVVTNWTGCYVGGNVGWKGGRFYDGSVDAASVTGPVGTAGTFTAPRDFIRIDGVNSDSAIAGGQVGCRWETAQHWVFGVEGDLDWTSVRGSVFNPAAGTVGGLTFVRGDIFDNRIRWEGSVRGIVGRAFDRLLVYGTGGVAFAEVTMTGNFIPTVGTFTGGGAGIYPGSIGSESKVLTGGTIGVGLAYALTKNWEIGGEYRYTRYEGANFALGQVASICQSTTACLNSNAVGHRTVETNEVMAKLNYRFDWAGPVVAKY